MRAEQPRTPGELDADRVLFVEGEQDDTFDVSALRVLLGSHGVYVVQVGNCENVFAAAHALSRADGAPGIAGGGYFAVVDRDDRLDGEVDAAWIDGPFAGDRRHLIWRRRAFENYFLEPEFVSLSEHFREDGSTSGVWAALLSEAQKRVFLDAANLVLMEVRARFRLRQLPRFSLGDGRFGSADEALAELVARDYSPIPEEASDLLSRDWLEARFAERLTMLAGGVRDSQLRHDRGNWVHRMDGKPLMREAVLTGRFFRVPSESGTPVQGRDLWRLVATDLMRRFDDLSYRPDDLVAVRDYFRNTQPQRFPTTDTAGSPLSP